MQDSHKGKAAAPSQIVASGVGVWLALVGWSHFSSAYCERRNASPVKTFVVMCAPWLDKSRRC